MLKKIITIMLAAVIILSVAPISLYAVTQGNTPGNIINRGMVAVDGDWIYYNNQTQGGDIYKIRLDGTGKHRFIEANAYGINIKGDFVYYIDKDFNSYGFKASKNRERKDDFIRGYDAQSMYMLGDVTYCASNATGIYTTDSIGNKSAFNRFGTGWVSEIYVQSPYIYYTSESTRLYRVNLDGTGKVQITDDKCRFINIDDNWIYFALTETGQLYKIDKEGNNKTQISKDRVEFLNLYEGRLYYRNNSDKGYLYSIKTDGTDKKRLNSERSRYIHIFDGWIYYYNQDDNNNLYKIRIDGTGKMKLD